ncbi:uncharacterized protein YbbC (DUF1343 family) [Balneicella halophila]|uniref:Uncharacterized protein YbbC (DUF1343 family) n=2 Tax=Balneicella halophila TaxID=1537566 RepID=A0A7L4UR35_BALHA|nr:uncharacterized protein YbbC (DUF1343 family) [Balneicella halophila]
MMNKLKISTLIISLLILLGNCNGKKISKDDKEKRVTTKKIVKVGAENTEAYLPLLQDKNVAVVTNHTGVLRLFNEQDSVVGELHIVDYLLSEEIEVKSIFAPEHGFRGEHDAGANIKNRIDTKTGLPIYSLHGKYKKPQAKQLENIDVVVFDIQDVGVRFYTYISTLHYVMEACAENSIPLIVLDRPNPNGHYVDGPVMEKEFQSFIGMHPVPIIYGMTIGEYALMIEGEHWLPDTLSCELTIVELKGWTHKTNYKLPIKPSPNLPTAQSVNLYPSLCLFEQTNVSIGRGTNTPFEIYGSPYLDSRDFNYMFIPEPTAGAQHPKHKGIRCYGENLRHFPRRLDKLELQWLMRAYKKSRLKNLFFKTNFELLSGTSMLREQIRYGWREDQIRESWREDLVIFKNKRKKYLLYPDFKE